MVDMIRKVNSGNQRESRDSGKIRVSKNYSGFNGSGRDFENSVLYRVSWQIDANRTGFLYPQKAISLVRANQPEGWDPGYPPIVEGNGKSSTLAQDVHACVCEKLGIEDYYDMRLYTALGSSLDKDHGIDAFLDFIDPEVGELEIITLDFTIDPMKYLNGHKANVIVFGKHPDVAARDVAKLIEKRRRSYAHV